MKIDVQMSGPNDAGCVRKVRHGQDVRATQESWRVPGDEARTAGPAVDVEAGGQGVEALYGVVRSIGEELRPPTRTHDPDALRDDPGVAFLTGTEVGLLGEVCRVIGVRQLALVGRSVEPDFDPDIEVVEILVEAGPGPAESLDPEDDIEAWVDFGFELERHIRLPIELVSLDEFAVAETERLVIWPRSTADEATTQA